MAYISLNTIKGTAPKSTYQFQDASQTFTPAKGIGLFSKETFGQFAKAPLESLKEGIEYGPKSFVSAVSDTFIPTKIYKALNSAFDFDKKIQGFETKIEDQVLNLKRSIGLKVPTQEEMTKIRETAAEKTATEQKKIANIREDIPAINFMGQITGDIANLALASKIFAPIAPAISGKIPLATKVWHPVLTRLITYAPTAAATYGSVGFLKEVANQIEAREFKPTRLIGQTLKSAGWGTAVSVGHVLPTTPMRVVASGLISSVWTTFETLIVNKEITAKDIPNIVSSGLVSSAFEFMNSKAVTKAYQSEVINNSQRLQLENRIASRMGTNDPAIVKKVADTISKLDVMVTMQGGEKADDAQLARSARNKMIADTMYKKDIDYIVVDKGMKPVESSTKPLSKMLTAEEKFLIQHISEAVGEGAPAFNKFLEPDAIVQEKMIRDSDLISQIDSYIKTAIPKTTPAPVAPTKAEFTFYSPQYALAPQVTAKKETVLPEEAPGIKTTNYEPVNKGKFRMLSGTDPMKDESSRSMIETWESQGQTKKIDEFYKSIGWKKVEPIKTEKTKYTEQDAVKYIEGDLKQKFGVIGIPEVDNYAKNVDLSKAETVNEAVKIFTEGLPEEFKENPKVIVAIKQTEDTARSVILEEKPKQTTLKLYRGEGGMMQDLIKKGQKISGHMGMLGPSAGKYWSETEEGAKQFGEIVEEKEVTLPEDKILRIENQKDYDWIARIAITKYKFKNIEDITNEGIQKIARDLGYKAIVVSPNFDPLGGVILLEETPVPVREAQFTNLPIEKKPTKEQQTMIDEARNYNTLKEYLDSKRTAFDLSVPEAVKRFTEIYNQAHKAEFMALRKKQPARLQKAPMIKKRIAEMLEPAQRKLQKTAQQLLKLKFRAESSAAKTATKKARSEIISQLTTQIKSIEDVRKQITNYVRETLETQDRGKAITLINKSKTQEDLLKSFIKIDTWAEKREKKELVQEVIKITKKAIGSPSVAIDYKEKIQAVVDQFELQGHREDTLNRLLATKKYIDERQKIGEDVEIPERIYKALRILTRKPVEEITIKELNGVLDELVRLDKIGRTKWGTFQEVYNLERSRIKDDLVLNSKPLNKIEKITPKVGENTTISQKAKNLLIQTINWFARVDKAILPTDVLFDWLDGGQGTYSGPNSRLIKGKIDYDWNIYQDAKDETQKPVVELIHKLKLKTGNFERIGFVAAREQENGIEKLKNLGYSETEISEVKLSKEEQEVLDLMRKTFDSQFPAVAKIMREVYNQPVGKVKNYFSFVTDWSKTDDAEIYRRMGPDAPEFGRPTKKVEAGFTIKRAEPGKQKIKLDALQVFLRHTDNVAYLVAMGRDVKMLYEIINSDEYKKSAGDIGQLLALEWIDLIARKGGIEGSKKIKVIDVMRKNLSAGVLGFKLSSAAIQWTTILEGMGMIGPKYGVAGAINTATSKEWREYMMKFPELRKRTGGEPAIKELEEGTLIRRIQAKSFLPLSAIDKMTAISVASGAYQKKMKELGKPINFSEAPNKEAMEYAQLVVRRTQAVSTFKDVPMTISRGELTGSPSVDRAIWQFQNFLLTRWSRIRYDALQVGITTKNPVHAINTLLWIFMSIVAAVGTRIGVDRLTDFITGKTRDKIDSTQRAMQSLMNEMFQSVPFVGDIFGTYVYDNELIPILNAPVGVITSAKRAIESKSLVAKEKGIVDFIASLMQLTGIPGSVQGQQIIKRMINEPAKTKSVPLVPKIKQVVPTPPKIKPNKIKIL